MLRRRFGADFDDVARFYLIACDVYAAAIHKDVAVVYDLTSCLAAVAEASTVANVVETSFKQLEQDNASDTAAAGCFFIVATELLFEHTVLEAKLLFFSESDRIFAFFLTTCANTVLAWWEIATLESF